MYFTSPGRIESEAEMNYVVVYDRKAADNPIVGIHGGIVDKAQVDLQEVHPGADPKKYGVVVVPEEIISQMTLREYKRDSAGEVLTHPVLQERTKELVSVADSALGENILFFGEPYAEVKSVVDLAGKKAHPASMNAGKGIIGLGQRSGLFTVTCAVDTGAQAPEMLEEEKNWEWEKDREGNIVGMKLLGKPRREPEE
jgi:hypothetical protein